ncbi:MAG: DUF87 domain-containing protein [Thermoplasmata archaeon]|nr:DUF87 domain-containing protein [Thermoplasmata archaeon]
MRYLTVTRPRYVLERCGTLAVHRSSPPLSQTSRAHWLVSGGTLDRVTNDSRTYRFRPVPARPLPEETRLFTGRMRRALRAAHGLGVAIRLRWSSDPNAAVTVTVPAPVGTRWMQFGLAGAYELGQWQATEGGNPTERLGERFVVTVRGASELPFPSAVDVAPWSEAVLAELGAIRAETVVKWELVPDPTVPPVTRPPSSASPLPIGELRFRTLPERVLQDSAEARRTGLRWRVDGKISTEASEEGREAGLRIAALLEKASHLDGGNGFRCRRAKSPLSRLTSVVVLSESELVGLFPPSASTAFSSRSEEAPEGPHLWLGRDLRGSVAGLPLAPLEGRHLLVLGETGMGKSSLVVRLAWQAVHWGNVVFFDPVGDTAREFLAGLPAARAPTVSWVSPSVPGLTLSILGEIEASSGGNPGRRERMVGDVVSALRRVRAAKYADSPYWGPRLEEMLSQALHAASLWPGASLGIAERLLSPGGFASGPVPETARRAVADVRRRIEMYPQDGDGARRLLSEITRSDILRGMLDDDSPTWSVAASLVAGQTTVVSGDAPQVGESVARHLLAVVLALVWNAVLAREEPVKTFLVLDEAQWYAHEGVAEMLRLGRRFNLHVWAVTQSLRSLTDSLRDALMTNSADVVLFRGAPEEVRDFARWVPELLPERIMRMPRGEAAALIGKGTATHWVHLDPPRPGSTDPARFAPLAPEVNFPDPPAGIVAPAVSPSELSESGRTGPSTLAGSPLGETLREMAQESATGAELTVRLSALRSRWSGEPALAEGWVRHGGRVLASAGILVRSGKDPGGSFWVLSRQRLEGMLGTGPPGIGREPPSESGPSPGLGAPLQPKR